MRHIIATAACVLALAACSTDQQAKIQGAAATPGGQLFCAFAAATGPIVAKMVVDKMANSESGQAIAIIATGLAEQEREAICAKKGGILSEPPANPSNAPAVAVVPPVGVALNGVRG